MMLAWGPQPLPRKQRMILAHEITERVKERFSLEVLAIGHRRALEERSLG